MTDDPGLRRVDPPDDELDDELVAYLDGELNPEQVVTVEKRLMEETDYRLRLAQLQRAFDLLDQLPRTDVDESFTRSTLELVVVSETQKNSLVRSPRRVMNWLWVACCLLCASLATYLFVNSLANQPNRQLVEDLPLIEDFDLYRYADNLEFLQMLDQQGLFAEVRSDEIQ